MRYKLICFCIVLFGLQSNIYCVPFRQDFFSIENKTGEVIVVEFGDIVSLSWEVGYATFDFISSANDPDKYFRTIPPRKTLFNKYYTKGNYFSVGYVRHSNNDAYLEMTPVEKYSAFIDYILIFKENGDLLYRIDDFTEFIIEEREKEARGSTYVLIIE